MKKSLLYIILLIGGQNGFTQALPNHFSPGEKLKFVIYYGVVNGGYIDIDLVSTQYEGKEAYHSKMLATTSGLADVLYKVRDEYQSYFDPETTLPYKSIRDISEGKYKKYNLAFFDHENLKVVTSSKKEVDITADIRDMVSVFYYLRNLDFSSMKSGDIIKTITFFDDEIFPFDMRYRGIETVKIKKGTFRCIKLVPYVETGRVFEKEDDMIIYLSADRNRVPVRVEFKLRIGTVKCDLIEFSGLKY